MKKGTTETYETQNGKIFKVFFSRESATITKQSGERETIFISALYERMARDGWKLIETKQ